VPATACALLTLMMLSHNGDTPGQQPTLAITLGSLTNATLLTENRQSARNHLAIVTFDSTNHSFFNSNIPFTSSTNFRKE
jgi:hypothetical protein